MKNVTQRRDERVPLLIYQQSNSVCASGVYILCVFFSFWVRILQFSSYILWLWRQVLHFFVVELLCRLLHSLLLPSTVDCCALPNLASLLYGSRPKTREWESACLFSSVPANSVSLSSFRFCAAAGRRGRGGGGSSGRGEGWRVTMLISGLKGGKNMKKYFWCPIFEYRSCLHTPEKVKVRQWQQQRSANTNIANNNNANGKLPPLPMLKMKAISAPNGNESRKSGTFAGSSCWQSRIPKFSAA